MTRAATSVAPPSSPHATVTMRANRRRDTTPELAIRSLLHARGLRFRVDRPIPTSAGTVRPDIVFVTARLAVFIDGCYWHHCPEHGELPRSNRQFWRRKFATNRRRDALQTSALIDAGWAVRRFWEHTAPGTAADEIARLISAGG